MSSTLMFGLESRRSTRLMACLRFRPRAAARPWPMVQTASEALCSTPRVASHSESTRLACRSWSSTPPRTWRTLLKENRRSLMTIVSLDLLLRAGRLVGSRSGKSRVGEFARICRRWRSCDSFRNRPHYRPILLCPEENEGMSEIEPATPSVGGGTVLHRVRHGGQHGRRQDRGKGTRVLDLRTARPCAPMGEPGQRAADIL